jgi:hypothetical protein
VDEVDDDSPLANGDTGRDRKGRFLPGNAGGPGNPHAAAVSKWRSQLVEIITPEDFAAVIAVLVAKAKAGEAWAVRELLDRTVGKPAPVEGDEGNGSDDGSARAEMISIFNFKAAPLTARDMRIPLPPGLPQPTAYVNREAEPGEDEADGDASPQK